MSIDNPFLKTVCGIALGSVVYAIIRYVTFTPTQAEHIPAFILNKAISMAAAIGLVMAVIQRLRGQTENAAGYFQFAMFGVIMHVPLSLALLKPGYFKDFFEEGGSQMNMFAELVIFFGALSLALIWFLSSSGRTLKAKGFAGRMLLITVLCHVIAMGICRGFNIDAKHAYLPPMWLISVVVLTIGVGMSFFGRAKDDKVLDRPSL